MSTKQNLLKTFLTSASIAAVIVGYSKTSFAQARATTGVGAFTRTGAMFDKIAANEPFTADSTIKLGIAGTATSNTPAGVNIRAIDVNGFAGVLAVTKATGLGSVVDTAGGGQLSVTIAAGQTLTLNGNGSIAQGNVGELMDLNGVSTPNAFAAAENTYTSLGSINFAAGSKLIIDNSGLLAGANAPITLNGEFLTPANGIIDVLTKLTATHKSIAAINEINIGAVGGAGSLTIDGTAAVAGGVATIDLLDGAKIIKLNNAGSVLTLSNSGANALTFNLKKNFDPSGVVAGAGAVGIVELNAHTGAGGLILQSETGAETLGIAGDEVTELRITGDKPVTIAGDANEVDLSNVKKLTVLNTNFIVQTATVSKIPEINIGKGESAPGAADAIDGIFIVDSVTANLLENVGDVISFKTPDSVLKIQNISNPVGTTVTLKATLPVAVDGTGIVELEASGVGGGALTLRNGIALDPLKPLGTDNTHRLKEFKISGDKAVNVNVNLFAQKILLNGTGDVSFGGAIDSGSVDSELKFEDACNVAMAKDTVVKTIDFNNKAGKITVAAGKKLTAILNDVAGAAGAANGEVVFAGAGELIGTAADVTDGIAKVTANGVGGTTLKILGTHKVDDLVGTNASTLEFAAGAKLIGSINSKAGGLVNLDFKGNSEITKAIGRAGSPVGDITFTALSTNTFGDNITMTRMTLTDVTFKISDDLTVDGVLAGNNPTIDVGTKELTYAGVGALTGDVKLNTGVLNGDVGKLIIGGGNLDLSGAGSVNITLTGTSDLGAVRDVEFDLVDEAGGALVAPGVAPVFVSRDTQAAVEWEFDPATLTITGRDKAELAMRRGAASVRSDDLGAFGQRGEGEGLALQSELGKLTDEARGEAMIDEITVSTIAESLSTTTAAVQDVVNTAVGNSLDSINSRISGISNPVGTFNPITAGGIDSITLPNIDNDSGVSRPSSTTSPSGSEGGAPRQRKQQSTEAYGVAAGDDIGTKMGIWASPLYSRADQKLRNTTPGYRATSAGGTLGFDSMINDNAVIGTAATFVNTNIKHKDKKVGDKTKADTYMLSLYGINSLPKNFFVQGILSFSHNRIKNKEYRSVWKKTAVAKYNSNSYGGELTLGYNHRVSEVAALTPTLGLRYVKFQDKGYKETGTPSSHTVAKKSNDRLDGVFGMRLSGISVVNETTLIPSIHGTVSHDFIGKKPKIVATIQGFKDPLPTRASKPTKTFYNVGADLTAKHRMMEYGVGYDAHLAKKYVGHQGMLKIRVNL